MENTFWERLKNFLGDRKESWLADQLGINRSSVATWKAKGAIPRADMLVRIAEILNCRMEDLIPPKNYLTAAEMQMYKIRDRRDMVDLWFLHHSALIEDLKVLPEAQLSILEIQIRALADIERDKQKQELES